MSEIYSLNSGERESREGITRKKLEHVIDVFLKGKTRGIKAYLDTFTCITREILEENVDEKIFVLVDIDACIATAYGEILPQNIEHIKILLTHGVQIGILSNCKTNDRLNPLIELGITVYEGKHAKPSEESFLEACKQCNFPPEKTYMVGDNPMTDGGAVGVLRGVIIVKAIPDDRTLVSFKKRVIMSVQNLLRSASLTVSITYNTKVLRSIDSTKKQR